MIKQDLFDLIEKFYKETWKYTKSDNLDNAMEYVYEIEEELHKNKNIDLNEVYNKLVIVIEIIRLKYGFKRTIVDSNIEIKEKVEKIDLADENLYSEYKIIKEMYDNYVNSLNDLLFLQIKNFSFNDGTYLALESLKSLITNEKYRKHLIPDQINEILIDCIKLINGISLLENIEKKYKEIIQEIWEESLSNSIDSNSFRVLFSNISGPIIDQANNLIKRPNQSSCSMISSNFIATYLGNCRRIGFIYPNNSNIIMVGASDLGSNVFGAGVKNKEKGTLLATPDVLEKIGIEMSLQNNEDLLYSKYYNEVLVDSKPCGIVIIGYGEEDINIDYEDTIKLADELGLPLYKIDITKYKDNLSERDKDYIAYHSILSYLGINSETMNYLIENNETDEIFNLIHEYKEIISQKFIELKKQGILNKENMIQALTDIVNIPNNNIKK